MGVISFNKKSLSINSRDRASESSSSERTVLPEQKHIDAAASGGEALLQLLRHDIDLSVGHLAGDVLARLDRRIQELSERLRRFFWLAGRS